MSVIFLDRDGVINENRPDYVKSWSEFHFLPGSREAIAQLTQAGHRIIVCTNQAGISKGKLTVDTIEEINHRMLADIMTAGGVIEKVYYCPHSKDENCNCRKPRPGLLLRASRELHLDMGDAVFIGDTISDIQAGFAAGIQSMLVLSGLGLESFRMHYHEVESSFRIAMNLKHAAELILKGIHIQSTVQSTLERACYSFVATPPNLMSGIK